MAAGAIPDGRVLIVAALYSLGAHGIMTLNDFKSVDGDRQLGIGSLPVRLGVDMAGRVACFVMAFAQAVVIALLLLWGKSVSRRDRERAAAGAAGADVAPAAQSARACALVQRDGHQSLRAGHAGGRVRAAL